MMIRSMMKVSCKLIDQQVAQSVGQQLHSAQRVLLVSHKRPDGDAIGSILGLGLALRAYGKDVQMVSEDGVPRPFQHLHGVQSISKSPQGDVDLVCVLDCSDLQRVGRILDGYSKPDVNIDHHRTNLYFARTNLVDSQAVATTAMLTELLSDWAIPIPQSAAAALLTGLITDSLGFRTPNISPKALRLAARLMELGANLSDLYHRALVARSIEAARLWGYGLRRLDRDGRMIWTSLNLEDRQLARYPGRDDADLINLLSAVDDADIALIFLEQSDGAVKVSWRSRPGIDISQIAVSFGGGGHPNASGAEIEGNLLEVQAAVLEATRPLLGDPQPVHKSEYLI